VRKGPRGLTSVCSWRCHPTVYGLWPWLRGVLLDDREHMAVAFVCMTPALLRGAAETLTVRLRFDGPLFG
jgi:hypothetical protein